MSNKQLGTLFTFLDAFAIVATGLGVMILHPDLRLEGSEYPAVIALFGFLYLLIAQRADLLSANNIVRPHQATGRILAILVLIFCLLVVLSFALKVSINFSRIWAFGWLLAMFIALNLNRVLFRKLAHSASVKKVAVLGAGVQGQYILNNARHENALDYEVVGLFDDRIERTEKVVAGHELLGTTDDLIEYAAANDCDRVVLALPWFAASRIAEIMAKLRVLSIDVSLAPDLVALRYPVKYNDDLGVSVFDLSVKPLSDLEALLKRAIDITIASVALIALLPVLIVTAIAIKLDSKGPVFFFQRRNGFNLKPMLIFKFRTMKIECRDDAGEVLTTRDDPRVTRLGHFLRKSSIDELPQLLNVLLGDMSIIGPRPHVSRAKAGDTIYSEAVSSYALRYRVKPGMTGWAQVNGWRGETDTREKLEKRVEHDLYYIENWSLWLDFIILIRTVWICVSGRNAI